VALALRVSDRFADYGLVGVLLISKACIEQFVMSCRVLGMEIEMAAVAHAARLIRLENGDGNSTAVCAPLVETADNGPCRTVYTKAGFTVSRRSDQHTLFALAPDASLCAPSHIAIRDSILAKDAAGA
jgi:predicted enzyme involved in methoxymalonyl-ACP biosynthesis